KYIIFHYLISIFLFHISPLFLLFLKILKYIIFPYLFSFFFFLLLLLLSPLFLLFLTFLKNIIFHYLIFFFLFIVYHDVNIIIILCHLIFNISFNPIIILIFTIIIFKFISEYSIPLDFFLLSIIRLSSFKNTDVTVTECCHPLII